MAINFPDSPSNGDTFTANGIVYTYNASTTLWDTTSAAGSAIDLSAVNEAIIPNTNETYDLGSSTHKWKDLYLSGSTLHLGSNATIAAGAGSEIVLPSIKVGAGSNAVKLSASATGGLQTQAVVGGVSQPVQPAGGTVQVADLAAMQAIASPAIGNMVSVVANKTIYMYNGTGFYKIATMVNESPSAITGVNGAYTLATDGTATTITAISTDPEGRTLSWSYAVTTGSLTNGGGVTATVVQGPGDSTGPDTNVFTITPTTNSAYTGSFSITFSVTDNVNGAVNAVSAFTLAFLVQNSRYTALSVNATNTGSNQTFDDASTSNHTITVNGDTTASTVSAYRHGGYSLKFENSVADDNNIKFNNTTAVDMDGEFCVETWIKFTVTAPPAGSPNARIFASDGSGANAADNLQLFPEYSGSYIGAVSIYTNGFVYQAANTSEIINDDQWHHLAVTRDSSNNLRWFIDGTLITTIASNTTNFQFKETRLGKRGDGGTGQSCFTGELRDIRVVIGSSVYESAFTPPTVPLTAITNTYLLVGDLPYIKDESTNNYSIHAGTFGNGNNVRLPSKSPISLFDNDPYSKSSHGVSAYFDGTGDYLSVSNFVDLGTDSWTIEGWYKFDNIIYNTTISQGMFTIGRDNNSLAAMIYEVSGAYKVRVVDNGVAVVVESSTPIQLGKIWNHIAITFTDSDNTVRIFINGNLDSSTGTKSTAWTFTETTFQLGARYYSGAVQIPMEGYIQDFRVVKGTAVYTSNFTPPTAPLTAITNTKFLLNPETSISDLSQSSEIQCFGDAATSTTQVKFAGTKSIYLDGTGDYIQINNIEDSWISGYTGDFTIEFWWYPTNVSVFQYLLTAAVGFQLYTNNSTLNLALSSSNSSSFFWHPQSMHTMVNNTWHHIAIVRNGNIYAVYVDGVSKATTTTSTLIGTDTNVVQLGIYTGSSSPSQGYFQDFRITKGLARYTSGFTPPAEELDG